MATNKKVILVYAEWINQFENLTDEEAGKLIKHLFRYVNDQNPESPDRLTTIAFEPIKQQLKRDLIKWESIIEKRKLAGKASADKRQQMLTYVESVEQTPTNPTVKDKVKDKVKVKVKDKEINKIQPPPFLEFLDYAKKNKPSISVEAVKLKYTAWVEAGWETGKGVKIKNWKSTLLNTLQYLPVDVVKKSKIDDTAGNNAAQSLIQQIDESINP